MTRAAGGAIRRHL